MSEKQLLAGAAQVDITPPLGTFINGDFVPHYAQYIHDQLYSKALVLQQGDLLTALVVVDICVMPRDFLDEVKSHIEWQTGIPPENILISATHTHAAGSVASVYLGAADLQYMRKLPKLIIKSVKLAKENLRPAKVAWGKIDVPEHVLSRRYKMKPGYVAQNPATGGIDQLKTNPFGGEDLIDYSVGATDPEVGYLAVKGTDDTWISLLANYSLHYVGDWDNGTISSDYFGEFSRRIKTKLGAGDDFLGMMSNGTSGNINIWDFANPNRYPSGKFEKSKLIAEDIASKVFNNLQQANWDENADLAVSYSDIELNLRKPSSEELEKASQVVMNSDFENLQIISHVKGLEALYAREQILLNDLPDVAPFPVQAFKIGQGLIGGVAAEMFAETGLWLKEKSPVQNYFTISLANGNFGYVPPEHEFANGGYETWRGRTSQLEKSAEEKIKLELLNLINSLG